MGANKLLRSMDQGKTFQVISEDLTTGGEKGNVPYGTLTTISESPFSFGFIYVGSDDGYVYRTENGGNAWVRISNSLPQGLWVSRVVASVHDINRVYITLNGYRNDDFKPYVYVSEDKGVTWNAINSGLPDYPINVIKEDPEDEHIVYLGTDNELYVSFDKGLTWQVFSNGIPKVAVHDLVIQNEAKDLVIGTHGRSIYKANIAALQQYNKIKSEAISVFKLKPIQHSSRWGSSWGKWYDAFEPETSISYYTLNSGEVSIEISATDATKLAVFSSEAVKGFNYFKYDLTISEKVVKNYFSKKEIKVEQAKNNNYYLPKGTYLVKISNGVESSEEELEVK
jgi:hypothetical protein